MPASTQMTGANKPGAAEASPSSVSGDEQEVAVVRFKVKECYLYSIPPAGTLGHRAEMWDVNKWLQARPRGVLGGFCCVFPSFRLLA